MDNGFERNEYEIELSEYDYREVEQPQEPEKKKPGGKRTARKAAALVLSGIIFGGAAAGTFQTVNYIGNTYFAAADTQNQAKVQNVDNDSLQQVSNNSGGGVQTDISQVANAAMPSIVAITNKSIEQVQDMFGFGQIQQYESESSGSGIIVGQNDTELLIATNNHVVDGADTLSVCFIDDQVVEAKVKGTDPVNDLAVVAVQLSDIGSETMGAIAVASLGDSDVLNVGEQVVAIGNALGYGQSVTTGIVSALNRDITMENMASSLIQTDAAINPGNSGGALLNMQGEVVGINSAKLASEGVEGMGYAIPISLAKPIINELMEQSTRDKVDTENRGYLGISGVDVTSEVSQMYDMPVGVYVSSVDGSANGGNEGLLKGDIITGLDKLPVTGMTALQQKLEYYTAGETVTLTVQRDSGKGYEEISIELTLIAQGELESQNQPPQSSTQPGNQGGSAEDYGSQDIFDFFR